MMFLYINIFKLKFVYVVDNQFLTTNFVLNYSSERYFFLLKNG